MIRILDPASLTDRAAASLVEVKESVSTWPQLASDVALGGAMVADAVRRIALGTVTASGRFYADLDALTADGREVALPEPPAASLSPARPGPPPWPRTRRDELRFVTACATMAPSGGNIQPWRFEASGDVLRAFADPTRSSLLDFRGRATRLALGAALEAAVIGARALGHDPAVSAGEDGAAWQLALNGSTPIDTPDGRRGGTDCCGSGAATAARMRRRASRARALARLADAGAPLLVDVARRHGGARQRAGGAGSRAVPLHAPARGHARRAALRRRGCARWHRRRLAGARRHRPRGDRRAAHRGRHGRSSPSTTAGGGCARRRGTRSPRRAARSFCVPPGTEPGRADRGRPRPDAALAARDPRRARDPSRGARRSCSSGCTSSPARWSRGSAPR